MECVKEVDFERVIEKVESLQLLEVMVVRHFGIEVVIVVKSKYEAIGEEIDNPDITMEEYIRLETEKALRKGKVYNWETATYEKIRYDEDVHFLRSVEMEFPAIVYNDALTSELELLCEPTVSPQHIDKVN
ncbi:hypothetical protein Tco_1009071 [Tanacetum coccineum]